MTWFSLSEQIREEFLDAQQSYAERVRTARVSRQAEREVSARAYDKARSARKRAAVMRLRPVRQCPRCATAFVPQRSDAVYCTNKCRTLSLSLRAYYRRAAKRPAPPEVRCANPRCSATFKKRGMKRCCRRRCTFYVAYLRRREKSAAGA